MNLPAIPKEKFEFANKDAKLFDKKFDDKPIGYFKDAWLRFRKSRAAVFASCIIILIVVFSLVCPLLITTHDNSFLDPYYYQKPARVNWLKDNLGIADGGVDKTVTSAELIRIAAIGIGAANVDGTKPSYADGKASGMSPLISVEYAGEFTNANQKKESRFNVRSDAYLEVGFIYEQVSKAELDKIIAWQEETGIQVLYPLINANEYNPSAPTRADEQQSDPNLWYKATKNAGRPVSVSKDGTTKNITFNTKMVLEDNYKRNSNGDLVYYMPYGGGSTIDTVEYRIRVLYYNWYQYNNGFEPDYLMGTDLQGYDMALRIADGIQISLIIAIAVCVINFILGALYGAVEGYYGGTLDLVLERVSDILSGVPFIVVATLFQLHLAKKVGPIVCLLFAYVLTGWIGTAYRVRTQFYRFKNQEYVMAARTLGARDTRIIWKHIFPNTLGTIITSSALAIPGAIMSESMLSYLGIISLGGQDGTSLGTLMSDAQSVWSKAPHLLLYPALIISLLMICFNLFGNGLRDAFNPSLRGVEE